jgi:hypothetical protein
MMPSEHSLTIVQDRKKIVKMYFEPIICYLSLGITEDDSLGDG